MTAPILWPVDLPLRGVPQNVTGNHVDERLSFQPAAGASIDRPKTSAAVQVFDMLMPRFTQDQLDSWFTFYNDTLGRGSLKFGWVHPRSLAIRNVQILPGPTESHKSLDRWRVRFRLAVVDATPSWASYLTTINGYMQIVDQPAWDAL